jgi:hypothetical protein
MVRVCEKNEDKRCEKEVYGLGCGRKKFYIEE